MNNYTIGDIVYFKDWKGKSVKGKITDIDYNQICVTYDNTDAWIIEEDILKIEKVIH